MNGIKQPLAVTILAGLYIFVGAIGLAGHFNQLLVSPLDGIYVELTEFLALLGGVFMLRGQNWARWLALAWMAFHVILSAFHAFHEFAIHAVFFAVIAWFLLSPSSTRYFRGVRMSAIW